MLEFYGMIPNCNPNCNLGLSQEEPQNFKSIDLVCSDSRSIMLEVWIKLKTITGYLRVLIQPTSHG